VPVVFALDDGKTLEIDLLFLAVHCFVFRIREKSVFVLWRVRPKKEKNLFVFWNYGEREKVGVRREGGGG
jgi:hypothetical protein